MNSGRNKSADDRERSATASLQHERREKFRVKFANNFADNFAGNLNTVRTDLLDKTRTVISWIEDVSTLIARGSAAVVACVNAWNAVAGLHLRFA